MSEFTTCGRRGVYVYPEDTLDGVIAQLEALRAEFGGDAEFSISLERDDMIEVTVTEARSRGSASRGRGSTSGRSALPGSGAYVEMARPRVGGSR